MHDRVDAARALVDADRVDEALPELLWLWAHMLEEGPSLYGVRLSYFASSIKTLVGRHEPARMAFGAIRDEAWAERNLSDWCVLNAALGESDKTVAWFDDTKPTPAECAAIYHQLFSLLVGHERWADAGAVHQNPMSALDVATRILRGRPGDFDDDPESLAELRAAGRAYFHRSAYELVKSLRAANRAEEAASVAREARRVEPSDELAELLEKA